MNAGDDPQQWLAVGLAADIAPGGYAAFTVDDYRVLVCHVDGTFHGIENRCSHAAAPLEGGILRGVRFMCPVHGAIFDVRSGEKLCPPAIRPVRCFDVRVADGRIEIARRPRPIPDQPKPSLWPLNM